MAAAKDFGKNNWKVFNASTYLPRWAKYIVNAISVFKTPILYDSFIRLGRFRTLFLFFKRFYIFQQIKVKKFYLYILSDVQTHDVMSLLLNHLTKVSGLISLFKDFTNCNPWHNEPINYRTHELTESWTYKP